MIKSVKKLLLIALSAIMVLTLLNFVATTVKADSEPVITNENFYVSGAELKIAGGEVVDEKDHNGLRFTAVLEKSVAQTAFAKISDITEMGILVIPNSLLNGELTLTTEKAEKATFTFDELGEVTIGEKDYYQMKAYIWNIPSSFYVKDFTARAYISTASSTVYSGELTRSIAFVANAAVSDEDVDGDIKTLAEAYIPTCTVTFDTDGGTAVASQSVKYGKKAVKPDSPEKEGCDFVGWFVGENEWDFDVEVKGDITVKAVYVASTSTKTKLVAFDSNLGGGLYAINTAASYSTEIKYGSESGSTKLVASASNDTRFVQIGCFTESDVTGYDSLIYRVYNDNDYDIEVWFDWQARTACTAKEWTEVVVPISGFPDNNNGQMMANNVQWITLKAADKSTGNTAPENMTFYVSALYGEKAVMVKEIPFDDITVSQYGGDKIYPTATTVSYSTEVKYGNEKGSTKLVAGAGNTCSMVQLACFNEADVTGYCSLVYRVFNDNDYDIEVWFDWQARTTCTAGKWTEVIVPISGFPDNNNGQVMANNIQWIVLKCAKKPEGNIAPEGMTLYLSALYASKSKVILPFDSSEVASYGGDKIYATATTLSYSDSVKYGMEKGSTKIVVGAGNTCSMVQLACFTEGDVTGYDALVYRVFNDNAYDIEVWFDWQARTTCTAGKWTEVVVPISGFPDNTSGQVMANNIQWMTLKAADKSTGTTAPEGMTLYLSAVYCTK